MNKRIFQRFTVFLLAACLAMVATSLAEDEEGHGCRLGGGIRHVVYVQFDNVHFRRDNPNVPSDLEQMPHLLNFLRDRGTLLTNHHTPLISHTADDIVTSLTGVYPDRHGIAVANSYGFFTPPGSKFFDGFTSAFNYWTDIVNPVTDPKPNNIAENGKTAPAPWVPYTRAGCNVGAASIANIEFENIRGDINNVFGPNSPEAMEAKSNPDQATADFVGIAVHCAAGNPVCSAANGGAPDKLPDEPGGYNGFSALYGHKFVAPVISPGGPLKDLNGDVITDGMGHVGFPGFGGISAAQTLAYVAGMLEHGVPVVFSYISDAHDNHVTDAAFGPGEAGYVAQLASYDQAFQKFFARLASHGMTAENTLFVFTSDENDHFAGGPPSPAGCDGIHTPCNYVKIGEIDSNIKDLLLKQDASLAATPFDIHFDMAPTFYIKGQPGPGDPTARAFERAAAKLTVVSPITGKIDQLTQRLADPVGMKLLHMITADPQRTPSFVLFGNPDYFFLTFGPDAQENPGFAWNHGGFNPEIVTTWLGLAGPGVAKHGVADGTWSDHTDIRPTMLLLTGLEDDYISDGRVLVEHIDPEALPRSVRGNGKTFVELAEAYKQINAPVAALGLKGLAVSTQALAGDNHTYSELEEKLSKVTSKRNAIASEMRAMLNAAEFEGTAIDETAARTLIRAAQSLLEELGGDED